MKKLILIFALALCGCKASRDITPQTEIVNSKAPCLIDEDQRILENAVKLFESKLQNLYPDLSIRHSYYRFIHDWSESKFAPEFYQDSLAMKVRQMNLWAESTRQEEYMELEKQLFKVDSMNPVRVKLRTEFSKCLARKMYWRSNSSSFLLSNAKYRISPRLARRSIFRWGWAEQEESKKLEPRLTIVLGIYYQTMFNLKS